jgi:hypothetical protein
VNKEEAEGMNGTRAAGLQMMIDDRQFKDSSLSRYHCIFVYTGKWH